MPLTVLECYVAILHMSDKALCTLIDIYNAGQMQNPNAREALEIIEGLPLDN